MKRFSDLKALQGHKNYYRSEKSGVIYYKDPKLGKFSTKEKIISKAKEFVERKRLQDLSGLTKTQTDFRLTGVVNPRIEFMWNKLMSIKISESAFNTMRNYNKSWKYGIEPFWGELNCININDETIQEYKVWYLKTYPERYAEKTVYHFKMLVRYIEKNKFLRGVVDLSILDNLDKIIATNTKREKVGRVYTEQEVDSLIDKAQSLPNVQMASRVYLGILLASRRGMRKMEILSLQWSNVFLSDKLLKVWSAKNKKWRTLHLSDKIVSAFIFQKQFTEMSKFVFPMPSDPKNHISGQIFDKVWIKVKDLSEIQGRARFHDLRHTFATITAEKGWPPLVACKALDMGLEMYSRVYAKPSDRAADSAMIRDFDN